MMPHEQSGSPGAVAGKAEPGQLGIEEGTKLQPGTISIFLAGKSFGSR